MDLLVAIIHYILPMHRRLISHTTLDIMGPIAFTSTAYAVRRESQREPRASLDTREGDKYVPPT